MMLTALPVLKNLIAMTLWSVSAFYYLVFLFSFLPLVSILMLSVIASAIELLANRQQK